MVHGKNRISYRIDRRLSGLAGPDYDATISFGLPYEPEDSQYGKSRVKRRKAGNSVNRTANYNQAYALRGGTRDFPAHLS